MEILPEPRTVKPRQSGYKHYPIVAVRQRTVLRETGETYGLEQFIKELPKEGPLLIVKQNLADLVAELDECYSSDSRWQWKASSKERDIYMPGREHLAQTISTVVHYFGWQKGTQGQDSVFHLGLDPVVFYGKSLDKFWPGEESVIVRLMKWATELRKWCRENRIAVRPTNGGMASQFLRDSRFYPEARRKVPKATNGRCRDELPGNYYMLSVRPDPNTEYQGIYLDQKRAHHYHAQHASLPDSNSLYAFGDFLRLADTVYPDTFPNWYGLYCLDLLSPESKEALRYSPLDTSAGQRVTAFVWSNEVTLLKDLGYKVEGVRAAWGSKHRDEGIRRYSLWAQSELDRLSDAAWLKPILLCTYGILAVKPRDLSFVFKRAKKGEPATLFAGQRQLHGLLVGATNKTRHLEPSICNVIHRGMIEAATRADSLGLAHWLTNCGHNILSIYADAVIVEDHGEVSLPLLPEPWTHKTTLHHLRFINKQAFVSGEMVKLPGVIGTEHVKFGRGGHKGVPLKPYFEALTGRKIPLTEYQQRELTQRRI